MILVSILAFLLGVALTVLLVGYTVVRYWDKSNPWGK